MGAEYGELPGYKSIYIKSRGLERLDNLNAGMNKSEWEETRDMWKSM
jgi:hypothetical protein